MGALKIFRDPDSLTMPTAIPKFFTGFCSDSPYTQNLKSVAFPDPEIIGVPITFGKFLDMPTLPLLKNFQWTLIRMHPINVPVKLEVRSFTCS